MRICLYCQCISRFDLGRLFCRRCYYEFEKVKQRAHGIVCRARLRGKLLDPKTLKCTDCDKPAVFYDHPDYRNPLEVEPVCRGYNKRRGTGLPYCRPRLNPGVKLIRRGAAIALTPHSQHRVVDINASYLLRIRDGKHPQVTDKTLKKLGLRRVEHFVRIGG